jgi:hypothetical protein
MSEYMTFYVRSTGEVIGPNAGGIQGSKNRKRREYGNIFTDRKKAERAAKIIKLVFKVTNRGRP